MNHSQEELKNVAMIDLANMLMVDEKKALDFHEAFDRIAEIKGFSEGEKDEQLVQFYTDLNVDGRFMTIGSNVWGLKRWYPVDQIDEEVAAAPTKKRKKASKDEDEDFDEDYVFEEEEELELEAGFDNDDEEDEEGLEADRIKNKDFDGDDDDDEDDEANVFAEGFDIIDPDEEDEE